FPDITFNLSGPDIDLEVVYDQRDGADSFSHFVGRLSSHWLNWVRAHHARIPENLDSNLRLEVLSTLRGDFELRPSLRVQVDSATEDLIRLTNEQQTALKMFRGNPRVLVMGCAGSGKTLLAATEAKRLAQDGGRVLFCCFNKHLATHLQKVVNHENIEVVNLHGFMARVIRSAGLSDQIPQAEESDLFSLFFPMYCLEGLEVLGLGESYDFLILDEAQDLL